MKFLSLLLLVCVIVGGIFLFQNAHRQVLGLVTPLAEDTFKNTDFYKETFSRKTTSSYPPNDLFPRSLIPKFTDLPDIPTEAYAVMNRKTGELLLAKNITQEMPIASVTKIMTAIVALENSSLDRELQVSLAAATIGEAEMGLTAGETVTVEELLYGLMLPSGNDSAETLAAGVANGRSSFIIKMNEKAQSLGMFDTFYFNPTGLDGDTRATTSFSTALDLLALTNYGLKNPTFAQIVSTYYKEFPYVDGKHKAFYLYNILQLDRSYPGIHGVKPGNTDFAGETLVSYAVNGDTELIAVLLNTAHSRDDVIKLYDFIYKKLGITIPSR